MFLPPLGPLQRSGGFSPRHGLFFPLFFLSETLSIFFFTRLLLMAENLAQPFPFADGMAGCGAFAAVDFKELSFCIPPFAFGLEEDSFNHPPFPINTPLSPFYWFWGGARRVFFGFSCLVFFFFHENCRVILWLYWAFFIIGCPPPAPLPTAFGFRSPKTARHQWFTPSP